MVYYNLNKNQTTQDTTLWIVPLNPQLNSAHDIIQMCLFIFPEICSRGEQNLFDTRYIYALYTKQIYNIIYK